MFFVLKTHHFSDSIDLENFIVIVVRNLSFFMIENDGLHNVFSFLNKFLQIDFGSDNDKVLTNKCLSKDVTIVFVSA